MIRKITIIVDDESTALQTDADIGEVEMMKAMHAISSAMLEMRGFGFGGGISERGKTDLTKMSEAEIKKLIAEAKMRHGLGEAADSCDCEKDHSNEFDIDE